MEQDSCLRCFSERYQSNLPVSLVCATIEAEEDWGHCQCRAGSMSVVRGITACVRLVVSWLRVWAGMWVLGVYVALGSAWVTYDLHMEKIRCCYL